MTAIPSHDEAKALVPHTLKEPLLGLKSGPLAALTFMVKDLFAIEGRRVSNGNPSFYAACLPGQGDGAGDRASARCGRILHRHHHLR